MATKAEKMPKAKTCKACKLKFTPIVALQMVCSPVCAYFYTMELRKKKECLEALQSRRETKLKLDKLKTKSEWLKDAQKEFNAYIRQRDKSLPCISCGRYHDGKIDAGHYRTVGSSPHLRFDERNCHAQCQPCNRHKSGDIINYRRNLIQRLGQAIVEEIESDNKPKHYTIDDIKAIKAKYKQLMLDITQIN